MHNTIKYDKTQCRHKNSFILTSRIVLVPEQARLRISQTMLKKCFIYRNVNKKWKQCVKFCNERGN